MTRLSPEKITAALSTSHAGRNIAYYPSLESTNTEAWNLVERGAASGTLVITDHQTAGRGRNHHTWMAAPGKDLTFSLIVSAPVKSELAGLFPLMAGCSVVSGLHAWDIPVRLKWPNDVFLEGKKLGGILCESRISGHTLSGLVIGIGLNINTSTADFTESLRSRATSLTLYSGKTFPRERILAEILNELEPLLEYTRPDRVDRLIERWTASCLLIGKTISFHTRDAVISGKFLGVDRTGAARIDHRSHITTWTSGHMTDSEEPPCY